MSTTSTSFFAPIEINVAPDAAAVAYLKAEGKQGSETQEKRLAELRRETVSRPVIYAGMGTCGLGAGAGKTLQSLRNHLKQIGCDADVIEVGCVGLCAYEPIFDFQVPGKNRLSYQEVTADNVATILDTVLAGKPQKDNLIGQYRTPGAAEWKGLPFMDEHPFFKPQLRWVLGHCGKIDPSSIEEYIAHGGYCTLLNTLRTKTREEVCNTVELAGLRGRGGGGFPTGKKWKFALKEKSEQKYLICNADEGDPGAFMDRALIEGDPHKLLEGMMIAAYGIGASKAYIYIRAEYPLAVQRLRIAIEQARAYGLVGTDIMGSGFSLQFVIKMGAGAFVCGEETALIHSIEGKRGMPRPRPPYPAVSGLFGKPTVINNVETLATVPLILKNGAEWFSAVGTANSKGTKIFALSGRVTRTGLVEVAMGTTIRQVVFDIGGGIPNGKKFKAVQIGGPSGGCIPEPLLDTPIDYESIKSAGAIMGSGGLVTLDETTCMVDFAKFFMEFIQNESCGKCIPCREGTKRLLEILQSITRPRHKEHDLDALVRFQGVLRLKELAEVIKQTSLCGLGQTAPNPVLSTLRWFHDEYEAHVFDRRCPAGACVELRRYRINPDKCKGCTLCAKKCPVEAIVGSPKEPHRIVAETCVGCGTCLNVCRFQAVEFD